MSNNLSLVFVLISAIVGFLLRKTKLRSYLDILGKTNIYLFLTLILTNSFYRKGLSLDDIYVSSSYLIFALVSFIVLRYILRNSDIKIRASIISTSLFPNAVNLAFPLLMATRQNYTYASIYAVTVIIIQSFTMPFLVNNKGKISSSIIGLIPVSGIIFGLALKNLVLDPKLSLVLKIMSEIGISMFSFVAGLSIPLGNNWIINNHLKFIAFWRLVVSPLLHLVPFVFSITLGLSINKEALAQTLVESVMPPALVNISYAIALGFRVDISSSAVVFLTPAGTILGILFGLSL